MNEKRKKILIVSHQYLPHISPRTTRWRLIVEDLTSRGYHVSVITGTKQIKEDNNIIYVGNKSSSNVVNQMREKSRDLSGSNIVKKLFYNILKKIYRAIVRTFAWPDYSMFWLLSIYKNKKRLNLDYDLMISVSLPFSSHIAAYILNKKNKKEWVMDIGDPFTLKKDAPENNKILYSFLNKYYENKFYSLANKILFTHEDAKSAHIDYFHINPKKVFIANPISDYNEDILTSSINYNYNLKPIKYGYFGIFTKGVRSPKNFLNYIKNQIDIEFHWYVNEDSKNEIITNNDELESIFHNLVDRDEALKLMSSTVHCLLSIGNLNNKQLPSKVVEYISTGKPVVHFSEIDEDPVINIAEDFPNLFIISNKTDLEKFSNQLDKYYKNISTFKKDLFIEKYSAYSITKILNLT